MSLRDTSFSPLDHGTIAKRRDPLLVDLAKALALLPAVAALTVYAIARDCWRVHHNQTNSTKPSGDFGLCGAGQHNRGFHLPQD